MMSSRFTLLVAVPPICVAVLWVAVLATSAITGTHPIWDQQPQNLVEAAILQDGAAVIRFVEQQQDVNRPAEVRAGVMSRNAQTLTPIEAAAATREAEMVQLLFDLGATPDAVVWQKAFCISDADSVRERLAAHRPDGASDECAGS
jgi:Tfp pilus assembly protein PilE